MGTQDVFNRLSSELTRKERQQLLTDLLKKADTTLESCEYHVSFEPPSDLKDEWNHLSFIQRLLIWFDRIVSGKAPDEILREQMLKRLTRKISARSGVISKDRLFLTAQFKKELDEVHQVSRYFLESVTQSMTHKTAFYAFMGRITIEEHYRALIRALDPQKIASKIGSIEEFALNEEMGLLLERLMNSMDLRRREVMQNNASLLYLLQKFCSYNFESFSRAFCSGADSRSCEVSFAGKHLQRLSSILYNMDFAGDSTLFESLYLFVYHADDRMDEVNEEDLNKWVNGAFKAISRLNEVVARLSLRDLTACCTGEYLYAPAWVGGGDDWFSSYKKFWDVYRKEQLGKFVSQVKFNQHLEICFRFLDLKKFPWLKFYGNAWKESTEKYPPSSAMLSFIDAFALWFDKKMSYSLKIVLGEGEFYKKQNHDEFLEAFELMQLTHDRIQMINTKCADYLTTSNFRQYVLLLDDSSTVSVADDISPQVPATDLSIGENRDAVASKSDIQGAESDIGDSTEVVGHLADQQDGVSANGEGESLKDADSTLSAAEKIEKSDGLPQLKRPEELYRLAEKIVSDFQGSLSVSLSVLHGVVYGEVGGRYDTLSNLAYLGGSRGQLFVQNLKDYLAQLQEVKDLLATLYDCEHSLY